MAISNTQTPVVFCSNCGHLLDANTPLQQYDEVEPGSISICLGCGQVCVFKKDLTLRNITDAELNRIKAEWPKEYLKIRFTLSFINQKNRFN